MIRNILICTTQVPFTTGGAESHVEGLRRALLSTGYNAEVVALPFKWYPPAEIMRSALAWRLLDLSEANGKPVDLVIGMKFPAYLVAHEKKVLWIIHQHRAAYNLWGTPFDDLSTYTDGAQVREWIQHCDKRFIPEARKVFANSQTVAERLRSYNGINSEPLYHPPPRADRLRCGEQGDYIFYPSRLEPQKRQELLIAAMQFVRTPVKVVFAGGSRDPKHYESMVKSLGVGDRVCLRGFVDDAEMIDLYADALGVCYLPFDEDYGYVTLEGMLSSKPIIVARDGGGATEFIEHERDGFIANAEPRAIAECLDKLYTDRARARRMGQHGQEKLRAMNLSWDHVVQSLIDGAG
ncbi:MAG TPA: glycosyl transferase [Blastocatellia bacterium]|nr:glycosyl transferase [Blastocatellia bacterium]HAF21660.1 glycosyl transferase [Blastocatellia bacterium]HCX30708.1 glycosyl transferase [Blastocatellia bacterium]